ncbi:aprataxin and PNK-like factor isoform X2 [Festucalex cinctus]
MSGFELLPIDGGDAIFLPPGETVLGRGPFLRVSDKRVSRHHGLLHNQDGRLRLKPTHANPCFLQSSVADDPRPLPKDAWVRLDHGDIFSLLPGQLMFRVAAAAVAVAGAPTPDGPLGQSIITSTCEEAARPGSRARSPPTPPARRGAEPQATNRETPSAGGTLNEEASASISGHASATWPGPPRKKRLLPAWMTAASPSRQDAKKSKRGPLDQDRHKSQKGNVETTPKQQQQEKEEEEEKGPRADEDDERPPQQVERVATETQQEADRERRRAAAGKRDVVPGTSDVTTNGRQNGSSKAKEKADKSVSGLRSACPYGRDCYRKNPVHFQECSHPGDSDYQEQEGAEPEEGERPECPYGTDCYRKNPLHRKQYKHTKRAARSRRTATTARAASDVDSDSGDSFIHDSDDDVDADSDYDPAPDSD